MKQNNDFKIGDRVRVLPWGKLVKALLLPKRPDNLATATTTLVMLAKLAGCEAEIHMIEGDVVTLANFSLCIYKNLYISCNKRYCMKLEVEDA